MRNVPAHEKLFVLLMSWLLPGYGFLHNGRRWHALFVFVVLESTFLAGSMLQGSVLFPDFNFGSEGFNLVTILTFLTQMFNGLLGLLSLLPDIGGPAILPYNETHHWADLGSFYLLVSGGMNYFVLASTYDHFYGRGKRLQDEGETQGEAGEAATR
jgi:hypothetical protein